ncbi:MAG: NADH-quinone oxidoreductase subunit L [Anaerolineae bacterium]|nr:NADH-quinone oxidoreductase subunit L [Anaerolineae bacterium]
MNFFFNYIWLIPLYPFLAFALIVLGLNRYKKTSAWLAVAAIALAWLHAWVIVGGTIAAMADPHQGIHVVGWDLSFNWIPTAFSYLETGFAVDGLTAAMLFMVPFVCLMIFIYATECMEGYEAQYGRYARFFAYVSLFAAGMLLLVMADNLLLLFIAWEIMGLCSYLLISFWFEKEYPDADQVNTPRGLMQTLQFWKYAGPDKISPKLAGLKAFLTTRIGDVLLFAGMLLLWSYAGTLNFRQLFEPSMLEHLTELALWGVPIATLGAILIFGGAVGKSAQFPLHVWLPDAMEGPTPVSALIHAATMVSAGVYLVARMLPLFATTENGAAMQIVAIIGAITVLLGATIGVAQFDIKRVLAYSTISQLGYMMMALGIGGFVAAVFHLITHSFFKALLFMGSGSVIHAMEHGAHHVHDHHTDPQDMRNMGGLHHKMRASYWAYLLGALALVGIFPLSGFWSKDEILAEAFLHLNRSIYFWVYVAGAVGVAFTAFYMGRQIGLVFRGKPRTALAEHAVQPGKRMTWSLLVLAFFAVTLGLINIPQDIPVIGHGWFHHLVGEVHFIAEEAAPGIEFAAIPFSWIVAGSSLLIGLIFFALGWWLYARVDNAQAVDPVQRIPVIGRPVFTVLYNKYYFDEIYRGLIIYPIVSLATLCGKFDYEWVINRIVDFFGWLMRFVSDIAGLFDTIAIDGWLVNGIPRAVNWCGGQLRFLQTGRVQNYMLLLVIGFLILVGLALVVWSGQIPAIVLLPGS